MAPVFGMRHLLSQKRTWKNLAKTLSRWLNPHVVYCVFWLVPSIFLVKVMKARTLLLTSFNKKIRPNNFFGAETGLGSEKLKQAPRHFSPKHAEDGTTQVSIPKYPGILAKPLQKKMRHLLWGFWPSKSCTNSCAIYSGVFGQRNAKAVSPSTLGILAKHIHFGYLEIVAPSTLGVLAKQMQK